MDIRAQTVPMTATTQQQPSTAITHCERLIVVLDVLMEKARGGDCVLALYLHDRRFHFNKYIEIEGIEEFTTRVFLRYWNDGGDPLELEVIPETHPIAITKQGIKGVDADEHDFSLVLERHG